MQHIISAAILLGLQLAERLDTNQLGATSCTSSCAKGPAMTGSELRSLREKYGLTQQQLADLSGHWSHKSSIAQLEKLKQLPVPYAVLLTQLFKQLAEGKDPWVQG